MRWARGAVAFLLVGATAGLAAAAAPPARLTPAQTEQLAQRDRWLRRADARYRAGKSDEFIAAIQKALALAARQEVLRRREELHGRGTGE